MVHIRLENVTKYFGQTRAVENVSLDIKDKEFLTLLGPSGCGKTTTLRLIGGLETLTRGNIYIGDELVNEVPPQRRDLAMVFQSYALYPHMSVFDNLAFPLKMRKIPKNEVERRVKDTAEMLRIGELLRRRPRELSGGQRQRVALGRAIIREPKAFLMDEPLSNLDAKLRTHMRVELKALQRKLGITTVYVTHDQVEAMTMSDRIALMNQGYLQQLETPNDIFEHPANLFSAGFIGAPPMNLIECSYSEDGFLDAGYFQLALPKDVQALIKEKATGSELILGARPGCVRILREPKTRGECFEADVFIVEPLGEEVIVDLKIGEIDLKSKCSPELNIKMGEKVWIEFEVNRLHIFDKKNGNAIL